MARRLQGGRVLGDGQKYFQNMRSKESGTNMKGGLLFLHGRGDALAPSEKHSQRHLKGAD